MKLKKISEISGADWPEEEDACLLYLQGKIQKTENTTQKELRMACVFEYGREMYMAMKVNELFQGGVLPSPWYRKPWSALLKTPQFPKKSWPTLSEKTRWGIMNGFKDSGEVSTNHIYWGLWFHYLTKTFEKLKHENERVSEFIRDHDGKDMDKTPQLGLPILLPVKEGVEHVLFTLDYSTSTDVLERAFSAWVESRKQIHKIQIHHKKNLDRRGRATCGERLRDLALWRLKRKLKKNIDVLILKVPEAFRIYNESSYSDAKDRATKYMVRLMGSGFINLQEAEKLTAKLVSGSRIKHGKLRPSV